MAMNECFQADFPRRRCLQKRLASICLVGLVLVGVKGNASGHALPSPKFKIFQ